MLQPSSNETKILGVPLNKLTDKLSISILKFQQTVTKGSSYVISIYDPLGILFPCHVLRTGIYSKLCDEKLPGDAEVSEHLKNKFLKLVKDMSSIKNKIPRSVTLNKESITALDLHIFGDTSIVASYAVVYGVVHQPPITNQGLVLVNLVSLRKTSPFLDWNFRTYCLKFNRKCTSSTETLQCKTNHWVDG